MTLLCIIIIIGIILGFLFGYDSYSVGDGIFGAFVGAWFGVLLGLMISSIVGEVGYNEQAQKIVSQERYEMAANGHYTLDDGELNFGYIDDNGDFQAVNIDDNFNIAAAPVGEAAYVEIVEYEASNKALAACSLGTADKGTVYNIYVVDETSTTE